MPGSLQVGVSNGFVQDPANRGQAKQDMLRLEVLTVAMPACNAEKTLKQTYDDIPQDIMYHAILVDDGSWDHAAEIAQILNTRTSIHPNSKDYGANQGTCYGVAPSLDDDFVFDSQILSQIACAGYAMGEIACPTRYMEDSSSIGSRKSTAYGTGVVKTLTGFILNRWGLMSSAMFSKILPI